MGMRGIYRLFLPVILIILLNSGSYSLAQQSLLDKEVNLNQNTGTIETFLKEIARKGNFSFTYTSKIDVQRLASVITKRQTIRNHLSDIFRFDSIRIIEQKKKLLLIPVINKPKYTVKFRSIKGIVIDKRSRRPLSYTNIFLTNKSIGTTANSTGRFELKIDSSQYNDTLGISHIGYEMFSIPVNEIDTGLLIIRLSFEKIQIREVIVKPLDPIYILTKANEKIHDNYDCKPAILTGFFRESTQQDNKSVSLSEAIIKVFKEPYTSVRNDQVKIYKGRKGSNTDEKEFVEFIVQGGLYNTLQLDIVKNVPTFLDADYFALYQYRLERTINHLGRLTYIIGFDQRDGIRYPCYKGKLYIDYETLAIVGASFEMPETGMSYAAGLYVKKSPRHTGVKPITAKYNVFYRYYNNKWNLSNVRSEILIRVKKRKDKQDKFNSLFSSVSEFVITHKDTVNIVRFKADEISRPKDIFEKQIGETDFEFWGNENIVIPDEPVEKTFLRIGKRNNILSEQEIKAIRIEEKKDVSITHLNNPDSENSDDFNENRIDE